MGFPAEGAYLKLYQGTGRGTEAGTLSRHVRGQEEEGAMAEIEPVRHTGDRLLKSCPLQAMRSPLPLGRPFLI